MIWAKKVRTRTDFGGETTQNPLKKVRTPGEPLALIIRVLGRCGVMAGAAEVFVRGGSPSPVVCATIGLEYRNLFAAVPTTHPPTPRTNRTPTPHPTVGLPSRASPSIKIEVGLLGGHVRFTVSPDRR